MKKIFAIVTLLVSLLLTVSTGFAATAAAGQQYPSFVDGAALVKPVDKTNLLSNLRQIETKHGIRCAVLTVKSTQGMSIQQYYQYTGLNQDIMLEQTRPQAEKRIRSRLALEAVANAENIEVSEEDLTKELEEMAENYNMKVDEVRNMLSKREIEAFRKDIRIKKALEIVVDSAVED